MQFLGLHALDWCVLLVYFVIIIYLGVIVGAQKTKNLGDFFVAGGKWGSLVSFIFVFASALAGNEAVVVSGRAYSSGLSGVWLWWNFLFATPIYFLFATYYRRARVYNLAEFLEMRYGSRVAALYAVVAGVICLLFIGTFLLAVAKILSGLMGVPVHYCIWTISLIVAAYVFAGGMMSTLLTDLLQGLMCLFILGFLMLPYLWSAAGGLETLRDLPASTWNFTGPGMGLSKVLALNLSALAGGIAAPWIYNWIAISKNERAATQCAWAHLWKRTVTLMFALYGILFFVLQPDLSDPELAWGTVMKTVLPVGAIGLMIASFFAAAMSSAATYATTSAAMLVDYCCRRVIAPSLPRSQYLLWARIWTAFSVILAATSTHFITGIMQYIDYSLSLLCFLGIPIYFGIVWRKANQTGMWLSLLLGIGAFLTILINESRWFVTADDAFAARVFVSTGLALLGMIVGTFFGPAEDREKLNRFFVIMNTPIGQEQRLVAAGIQLPALVDAGLMPDAVERLDSAELEKLYQADTQQKIFGPTSSIELRREKLGWYMPGFFSVTFQCVALVVLTWVGTRLLFVGRLW
jgi:Na+/proline symporter